MLLAGADRHGLRWLCGSGRCGSRRRRAARLPRGERDDQQPAPFVHRASRSCNHLVEGPLRDPHEPQQALYHAHRQSRTCSAPMPGLDVHCGLVYGIVACVHWLCADGSYRVRLLGAHRRRQPACRALERARRAEDDHDLCASSAAARPGWPAWSRSRRFTVRPTLRWWPATAIPAFWWRFWRATTRWRHARRALAGRHQRQQWAACNGVDSLPDATVSVLQGHSVRRHSGQRELYGRYKIFRAVPAPVLSLPVATAVGAKAMAPDVKPNSHVVRRAWGVPLAVLAGAVRDQRSVLVRKPGRVPDREESAA